MRRNFWDTEVLDGILDQKGRRRKRARGKRKNDVSRIANKSSTQTRRSGQTPGSEFIIAANFNYLYKRGRSERRCRVSCMRLAYMEPRLNEGFEGKCMADCAGKCSKQ